MTKKEVRYAVVLLILHAVDIVCSASLVFEMHVHICIYVYIYSHGRHNIKIIMVA